MQSSYSTRAQTFTPITLTITIESREELAALLLLTNLPKSEVPVDLITSFASSTTMVSAGEDVLPDVISSLVPCDMWSELRDVFAATRPNK